MTTPEFKRVARLLKVVYKELEKEAITEGIDLASEEYEEGINKAREAVLKRMGFTMEEYREVKKQSELNRRQERDARTMELMSDTKLKVERLGERHIPTTEEIVKLAKAVALKEIKPPIIINQIVKETVVEKPIVIEKTIKEERVVKIDYDDHPIREEMNKLSQKIDGAPKFDFDAFANELREEFSSFKKNINTFGAPDFRKLAMGLQQQIDDVNTATLTTLAPTGAINGSNTVFVFSSPPNIIVTDGKVLQKTASDATANWTGTTTVTLTIAPEFDIFGL